nr:MAG TPA: hypothetical protein [Caudoviricetes sp.]
MGFPYNTRGRIREVHHQRATTEEFPKQNECRYPLHCPHFQQLFFSAPDDRTLQT